ncbi:hypothetical protein CCACVL1_20987 [Corchorus capsularis]|uniref:Uncharacterized protein n=1 Tax=Corchorus capsularis TaxID=210143 RepID=A0A1R3H8W1_COCAP|nr:hypothetical protein CCACVL1_20987 [Corchorus capsularis]
MRKLKLVDVKGSQNLTKTPDFSRTPNLETLVLEGTRIVNVHPTMGFLQRLKVLNLRNCRNLRNLPTKLGTESLETLILSGCSNVERIPENIGEMKGLVELYLDGTGIKELPSSIGNLRNLVLLNLKDCSNLFSLPNSINGCKCLKTLNLSGCSKVENLPENLQLVEVLEELDLSETSIRTLPSFIFHMNNLKVLSLQGCNGSPSKIQHHWPFLSKVNQRVSPNSKALSLPTSLSGLRSLKELNLSDCNLGDGTIPSDIGCLSTMETLILCNNNFTSLPATFNQLSKLTVLKLADCKRLKSLPELPTSVSKLWLDGCSSLEVIETSSTAYNSTIQQYFCGFNCFKAENNNVVAMLKRHLKVTANARIEHDIFIPGNEIPRWFSHQRIDSSNSIKILLPPNLLENNQFMGFAFCCVFLTDLKDSPRRMDPISYFICPNCNNMVENISCRTIIDVKNSREIDNLYYHLAGKSSRVTEDHLWLHYWPRDKLKQVEISSSTEEGLEIEVLFKIFGVHSRVKKCATSVYERF